MKDAKLCFSLNLHKNISFSKILYFVKNSLNLPIVIDGNDACSSSGCAQLCLLKPSNQYSCACKDGLSVGADNKSCVGKFIVGASKDILVD